MDTTSLENVVACCDGVRSVATTKGCYYLATCHVLCTSSYVFFKYIYLLLIFVSLFVFYLFNFSRFLCFFVSFSHMKTRQILFRFKTEVSSHPRAEKKKWPPRVVIGSGKSQNRCPPTRQTLIAAIAARLPLRNGIVCRGGKKEKERQLWVYLSETADPQQVCRVFIYIFVHIYIQYKYVIYTSYYFCRLAC